MVTENTTLFDPDEMPLWIQNLCSSSTNSNNIIAGVNDDDCAVIEVGGNITVITTDYLNSYPIASQLNLGGNYDLGWLSVVANISDLCGSGAKPMFFLSAIKMNRETDFIDFEQLMKGISDCSTFYNVPLIGGDTKLGKEISILGVAVGSVKSKDELLLQNAAKPGDDIWVSGSIGSVTAATIGIGMYDMSHEWKKWAKNAVVKPVLEVQKSQNIASLKTKGAGTDISDGLSVDLFDICKKSNVGAIIDSKLLPMDKQVFELAKKIKIPAWAMCFGGGGDYRFLVTTAKEFRESMKKNNMIKIGSIIEGSDVFVDIEGRLKKVSNFGHKDNRSQSFPMENYELVRNVAGLKSK